MSESEQREHGNLRETLSVFADVFGVIAGVVGAVTCALWFAEVYRTLFWCGVAVTGSFVFLFMLGHALRANNDQIHSLGTLLPDTPNQLSEKPAPQAFTERREQIRATIPAGRLSALPVSTPGAQQLVPNLICSRARVSHIREDARALVLEKAAPDDKGAIRAALVEFGNEPEPNKQSTYINGVIARIFYKDSEGQIIHRVNNGWWIAEDFNSTTFDVGDVREVVVAMQRDGGRFIAIDDRRESVNRHGSPDVTLLEQSQYNITIRLIGGARGEFVHDYDFQLTLEPQFSIKARNLERENAGARKPDKEILDITPDNLMDVFKDFTPTQAEHLALLNKGKWIRASGKIASKALYPREVAILLSLSSGRMIQTHIPINSAKDVERLMALPNGGVITILGQIQNVHRTAIFLDNCELVDT